MDHFNLSSLLLIAPEGCMCLFIISLQLLATFGRINVSWLHKIYLLVLIGAALCLSLGQSHGIGFSQMYQVDDFAIINKIYILISAIMVFCSFNSYTYQDIKGLASEYLSIILIAALGGMVAVSARNFIVLFLALELQSLATYILVSSKLSSLSSAEAGIKYFTLGSLMSCFFLFGISLLYGVNGSLYFDNIAQSLELLEPTQKLAATIATVLIMSNFLFKLSVSPWHFWAPDVYQGSSLNVLAFLSSVPKVTALAIIIEMLDLFFHKDYEILENILRITAILSMIVGTLGGIRQNSIKRLLAYSTIADVGYLLIILICHNTNFSMIYLLTYIVSVLGMLAIFASLRSSMRGNKVLGDITLKDIAGLAKVHPKSALGIALICFSLAGIPPLVGFFLKFYVIMTAMANQEYWPAAFALASNLVAAYYYLKIVKSMYFEEGFIGSKLTFSYGTKVISIFSGIFILGIVLAIILNAVIVAVGWFEISP